MVLPLLTTAALGLALITTLEVFLDPSSDFYTFDQEFPCDDQANDTEWSTAIPSTTPPINKSEYRNDSSTADYARHGMMKYFRGSEKTVEMLQPKLKPPGRTSEPKAKLTFVKQMKTYTTRSTPSKKFYEAVTDIEWGVAQAKVAGTRTRYSKKKIQTIKSTIELAVEKRMYQFARHRLGQALFLIREHNSARTSRSKRSPRPDASTFIEELKRELGNDKFDKFMAVRGDVTLMFAIDTTGSMSDEIETAKRIAVDVVNYKRENPVNFILSPFSDPGK
jgi:hypothetical protein